jgi:hypothetical protein
MNLLLKIIGNKLIAMITYIRYCLRMLHEARLIMHIENLMTSINIAGTAFKDKKIKIQEYLKA